MRPETVELMTWQTHVTAAELATDAAWQPLFSPYHGEIVPAWMITQMARWRMESPR
jgi:hypothetical protein